jgi:hypothetical protein
VSCHAKSENILGRFNSLFHLCENEHQKRVMPWPVFLSVPCNVLDEGVAVAVVVQEEQQDRQVHVRTLDDYFLTSPPPEDEAH